MHTDQERIMALAGIYQAAHLTQQIAQRGMADTQAMTTSISSLFKIDAADVDDVYGGVEGILGGLRLVRDQLANSSRRDVELTRYIIALIQLERKLSQRAGSLEKISTGIADATRRLEHFSVLHPNIISQLADIYKQTISSLQPRIMVKGEPLYLQNPDNTNKIRALLLAGIRSAMLWRQLGGLRRQIIFNRRKIINNAQQLLGHAKGSS